MERKKRKNVVSTRASVGRLSSLPEGILCHILSFLPTKLYVRTSVLATRWRFLWTHVPNLDLDEKLHLSETSFPHIIERVMLRHEVRNLNAFRLFFKSAQGCSYRIETWITTAIARNVKRFYLVPGHDEVILPRSLFTCKTLVDLRLYCCRCVGLAMAGSVCLPSLKKLHLYSVKYQDDESFSHMLSGCPVLEELVIDKILKNDLVCCRISSPTLKRLTIIFQFNSYLGSCSDDDNGNDHNSDEYTLEIYAPALRYLKVEDCLSKSVSVERLTALIKADIHYNNPMAVDCFDSYVFYFLGAVSNVNCLKLTCNSNQPKPTCRTLNFDNLTKFEVDACCMELISFLGKAPNLEVLIIHQVDADPNYWPVPYAAPYQIPECLESRLRSIRYYQFTRANDKHDGMDNPASEFQLIEYLLRNSLVLERVEIHFKHGVNQMAKFNAVKRISLFERGSKACKVAFN